MGPAPPTARHVWYGLLKTASSCSAHHHYPIHCKENMTDAISICVDAVALPVAGVITRQMPFVRLSLLKDPGQKRAAKL